MSKIIIANWKMNPVLSAEAINLAKATDYENLVICPPFAFLDEVAGVIKKAKLGAQDLAQQAGVGPHTGEVSAQELKDSGVEYVIIGHSERRQNLGETDEMVAQKTLAAVNAGLIPILCVGETWEEKQAGQKEAVIAKEIKIDLFLLKASEANKLTKLIYIAYEPIWAISTSKIGAADKPEDTLETISFIKKTMSELNYDLPVKYLYGGSVNAKNAADFLQQPAIEGALIGGASLKPEELNAIMKLINV